MFKHQGKSRTLKHNMQLATVLSFVAGIVNVTGFLSFQQLTTNVTGHFALFINDLSNFQFWHGTIYFLYILSFLLGSFTSGFLIEQFKRSRKMNVYLMPTLLESLLLLAIAIWSNFGTLEHPDIIACMMLFAMGLQNSFVTKISDAVVRTTHLTGLFTDLGIELAQLFFKDSSMDRRLLLSTIQLRVAIICFFFLGGSVGGFLFSRMDLQMNTLALAAIILMVSLFYDDLRFAVLRRKQG
ncbi:MAG: DUF1275 domain-containing protein [Flavobacteriales bacterium]|nr:DUF1275 domain-containing protein [Flavobacteriales bacterium]